MMKFLSIVFIIRQFAWNNKTTHEILRFSSSYWAGRLEQLDYS
jgi:hypothetical protein